MLCRWCWSRTRPTAARGRDPDGGEFSSQPRWVDTRDWSEGRPILAAYEEVNALFEKQNYDAADRQRMEQLLVILDIYSVNQHGAVRRKLTSSPRWAWLRKNRGGFDRQPEDPTQDIEITASGRDSWIGWVELAKEATDETSTRMTAQVMMDVDAEIIAVIEAEDRPSLLRFNQELMNGKYGHVMLIDGNDERGIDVGIMTKSGFPVRNIRSNVDAEDALGIVFSRDCPEYEVTTTNGTSLYLLIKRFKSQSGGGGAKRRRQAVEVRQIVDGLVGAPKASFPTSVAAGSSAQGCGGPESPDPHHGRRIQGSRTVTNRHRTTPQCSSI